MVFVTLVGQGLTLAPLASALGLRADVANEARTRNEARAAAVAAALKRLDELGKDEQLDPRFGQSLRDGLERRATQFQRRVDVLDTSEGGQVPRSPAREAALALRRAIIDAQREEILRWRDAERLPDESLRILQRELDHEEHAVPRI